MKLHDNDLATLKLLQQEHDNLLERWKAATPYSQAVANVDASFKSWERRLGRAVEAGLFQRIIAAADGVPPSSASTTMRNYEYAQSDPAHAEPSSRRTGGDDRERCRAVEHDAAAIRSGNGRHRQRGNDDAGGPAALLAGPGSPQPISPASPEAHESRQEPGGAAAPAAGVGGNEHQPSSPSTTDGAPK